MPATEPDDVDLDLWYPTVDDVLVVHEDVIAEDDDATPGVEEPDRIEYVIDFIKHGHFDEGPSTIHEKAFHLLRLIASNHWFADGNKRTALNVTELFYLANGYQLDYGEDIRSMLKLFSVRESLIDRAVGQEYLRDQTTQIERQSESGEWNMRRLVFIWALSELQDADAADLLPDEGGSLSLSGRLEEASGSDGTINSVDGNDIDNDGG